MTSEDQNAIGTMNTQTWKDYGYLKSAYPQGSVFPITPSAYLNLIEKTDAYNQMQQMMMDEGIYYFHGSTKTFYRIVDEPIFQYAKGLSQKDEDILMKSDSRSIELENGLKIWRRNNTGILVSYAPEGKTPQNFLIPEYKSELEKILKMDEPLVIRSIFNDKRKDNIQAGRPGLRVVSLED